MDQGISKQRLSLKAKTKSFNLCPQEPQKTGPEIFRGLFLLITKSYYSALALFSSLAAFSSTSQAHGASAGASSATGVSSATGASSAAGVSS